MSAERIARLHRLSAALEARRRLASIERAALEREIAACENRTVETLAFAETAPSQGPLGRALTRRLADLDRARQALAVERDERAAAARRDRRLARAVERLAGRLDAAESRRLEWAFLEAWLDASFGRSAASLPPASPPSLAGKSPPGAAP